MDQTSTLIKYTQENSTKFEQILGILKTIAILIPSIACPGAPVGTQIQDLG